MLDFDNEIKTVHTSIYVIKKINAIPIYGNTGYLGRAADAVDAMYLVLGEEHGLKELEAYDWARDNINFHIPTLTLIHQLSREIFVDLPPTLRRDAILQALIEFAHMLYIEESNLAMYGRKY